MAGANRHIPRLWAIHDKSSFNPEAEKWCEQGAEPTLSMRFITTGCVLFSQVCTASGAWQVPDTDTSSVFEADSCLFSYSLPPFPVLHLQHALLSSPLCLQTDSSVHLSKARKLHTGCRLHSPFTHMGTEAWDGTPGLRDLHIPHVSTRQTFRIPQPFLCDSYHTEELNFSPRVTHNTARIGEGAGT